MKLSFLYEINLHILRGSNLLIEVFIKIYCVYEETNY
jgi:hypothetical protein